VVTNTTQYLIFLYSQNSLEFWSCKDYEWNLLRAALTVDQNYLLKMDKMLSGKVWPLLRSLMRYFLNCKTVKSVHLKMCAMRI